MGMKEKVSLIARGIFDYEEPAIILSQPKLYIEAELGKTVEGTFQINNSEHTYMKGVLYSDHCELTIKTKTFADRESTISYEYHAEQLDKLGRHSGNITIVTNCGVVKLPYEVTVQAPYIMAPTSGKKIKNLDALVALASKDWTEAVQVVQSPEFSAMVLTAEEASIYQTLRKGDMNAALEEFLVSLHKKEPVIVTINQTEYSRSQIKESYTERIVVKKNTYGYTELTVEVQGDFIKPITHRIGNEQFVGGEFPLEFLVDYEQLQQGENHGLIQITNIHQSITISVMAQCENKSKSMSISHSKKRYYENQLTRQYLEFRMSKIDRKQYEEKLEAILGNLIAIEPDTKYTLWQAHLYMIAGRTYELDTLMHNFEIQEHVLLEESVYHYLAYLYLKALYTKNNQDIDTAIQTIQEYYGKEYNDWILLWYLFYLDHEYDEKKEYKLKLLKLEYEKGNRSPVLYYEAYLIYAANPVLLQELGSYELQVLHWSVKNKCISQQLAEQYAFLVSRTKGFNRLLFRDLTTIYERYPLTEILSAICKMLINGHRMESRYFKWYQLGVKEQLKLTELYECYMYAIPQGEEIPLDQSILVYFIYNNTLSDSKKAYLYAYLIQNKEQLTSLYNTYQKQMEVFAKKQIMKHAISKNLSILYREMIQESMIDGEMARAFPYVMFRKQIRCEQNGIIGVVVTHNELKDEEYYPLIDQKAEVNIYTKSAKIYLVDEKQNRYKATIPYDVYDLIDCDRYLVECYRNNPYDLSLLVYLADGNYDKITGLYQQQESNVNYEQLHQGDEIFKVSSEQTQVEAVELKRHAYVDVKHTEIMSIQNRLLHSNRISQEYKKTIYVQMLDYYYERDNFDKLEEYLLTMNIEIVKSEDRPHVIEYLISRQMYEKALHYVEQYGYEQVSKDKMLELATRNVQNLAHVVNVELLCNICYDLFQNHVENDATIMYLATHMEASNEVLYSIFQHAKKREVEVQLLEERLLGQMLFSGQLEHSREVFESYCHKGHNKILIKGYLNAQARNQLLYGQMISASMAEYMTQLVMKENLPLCRLALIEYYSTHPTLSQDILKMINVWMEEFAEKKMVLPFFQRYIGVLDLPCTIFDKFFVQYIANPKHHVYIHYQINGAGNVVTEAMPNVIEGIRVSDFILFQGETMEYYISEEDGNGTKVSDTVTVKMNHSMMEKNNKFGLLNLMLAMEENKEDKNLIELMKYYATSEYLASSLYQPL